MINDRNKLNVQYQNSSHVPNSPMGTMYYCNFSASIIAHFRQSYKYYLKHLAFYWKK